MLFSLEFLFQFLHALLGLENALRLLRFHVCLYLLNFSFSLSNLGLVTVLVHELDLGDLLELEAGTVLNNLLQFILEVVLDLVLLLLDANPDLVYLSLN